MRIGKRWFFSKIIPFSLAVVTLTGASLFVMPFTSGVGGLDVSAASVAYGNCDKVTLYAMDDWAREYISIPSSYCTSYNLPGACRQNASYTAESRYVSVSSEGVIEPAYDVTYWYSKSNGISYGTSTPVSGKTPTRVTRYISYGESVVTVKSGGKEYTVNVEIKDYVEAYVNKVIDDYLKAKVTPGMSTYEKLVKIAEFIASRDYDPAYCSVEGLVVTGGGDCWASSDTAVMMAKKLGLRAWTRDASKDPDCGSSHKNAVIYDGKDIYILEAGYSGKAPRKYDITKRSSFWSWRTAEGGKGIELYQYYGEAVPETLTIPSVIDGKTVTGLAENLFCSNRSLKRLVLPDSIKYIGEKAFCGCSALESVDLPSSLETIGTGAFENCRSLVSADLNATRIKRIDDRAFANTGLRYVRVPDSVTDIGSSAFSPYLRGSVILIVGKAGGVAEKYAKSEGLAFLTEAKTVRNTSKVLRTEVSVGDNIKVTAACTGGKGPYKYEVYRRYQTDSTYSGNLISDGSSTVTFKAEKTGQCCIRTVVTDAYGMTQEKLLCVNVGAALENRSVLSTGKITLGKSIKITSKATGGLGGYKYGFDYKLSGDKAWTTAAEPGTASVLTFKPAKTGSYTLRTVIKDSAGHVAYKTFSIVVKDSVSAKVSFSSSSVTQGQSVSLKLSASGGFGGYEYKLMYLAPGTTTWATALSYSKTEGFSMCPTVAGKYIIRLTARDSVGYTSTKDYTMTVTEKPLANASRLESATVTVGAKASVLCSASGGSGSYRYSMKVKNSGDSLYQTIYTDSTSARLSFKAEKKGTCYVQIVVKDSKGKTDSRTLSLTVR